MGAAENLLRAPIPWVQRVEMPRRMNPQARPPDALEQTLARQYNDLTANCSNKLDVLTNVMLALPAAWDP